MYMCGPKLVTSSIYVYFYVISFILEMTSFVDIRTNERDIASCPWNCSPSHWITTGQGVASIQGIMWSLYRSFNWVTGLFDYLPSFRIFQVLLSWHCYDLFCFRWANGPGFKPVNTPAARHDFGLQNHETRSLQVRCARVPWSSWSKLGWIVIFLEDGEWSSVH